MKKKILIVAGVILIAVCLFFCFAFFGNPVSKILVTKNAGDYIALNFQDSDYVIESVNYDFKTSDYYVSVISPDSTDNHFTLYAGLDGKIVFDTYDSAVLKKWNTAERINNAYRDAVDTAFADDGFAYNADISFGDIEFADSDHAQGDDIPDYAIFADTLTLDADYDIFDMGSRAGKITLYVCDNDVSAEKAAEILLALKTHMDSQNVSFRAVHFVLESVRDENGNSISDARIETLGFAYADIYADGLSDRITQADKDAKAYYAMQDKE